MVKKLKLPKKAVRSPESFAASHRIRSLTEPQNRSAGPQAIYGGARATASAAMMPPAPGLLSTMIDWPFVLEM
jgi:hypothetical protein